MILWLLGLFQRVISRGYLEGLLGLYHSTRCKHLQRILIPLFLILRSLTLPLHGNISWGVRADRVAVMSGVVSVVSVVISESRGGET